MRWIAIGLALLTFWALVIGFVLVVSGEAHAECNSAACEKRVYKKHRLKVIKPHREWLRTVGDCENGAYGGRSLRSGLKAVSPGGTYQNRYQFDAASWRATGAGVARLDASWLEQAYRAVIWLKKRGPGAWPRCGNRFDSTG